VTRMALSPRAAASRNRAENTNAGLGLAGISLSDYVCHAPSRGIATRDRFGTARSRVRTGAARVTLIPHQGAGLPRGAYAPRRLARCSSVASSIPVSGKAPPCPGHLSRRFRRP
jgi:hypothetical protein